MNNSLLEIRAFSIVETVISLIISTIIISIVYVLFSITEQRLIDIKKSNRFSNDISRLSFAINKDIFEYDSLCNNSNSWTFLHYNETDSISYSFQDSLVIRVKNDFIDTLHVQVKKINFENIKSKNEKFQFTKIKLNVKDSTKTYELKFYKRLFPNTISNLTLKN